jgi:CDGSH iron-sulfur domain-containing protein 3
MSERKIAQRAPYAVDVVEGKTYFWCACGHSANQPFCDGSHKVTSFTPVAYKADKTGKAFFCGCKHTHSQPLCDGTHQTV